MEMNMIKKVLELKPEVKVEYRSFVFTLATAQVSVHKNEDPPEFSKTFYAEGIARRSHKDKSNQAVGDEIAMGRALRSLAEKIFKGKYRHNNFMG